MANDESQSAKTQRVSTGALKLVARHELVMMDFQIERLNRALKAGIVLDDLSDTDRARMLIILEEMKDENGQLA